MNTVKGLSCQTVGGVAVLVALIGAGLYFVFAPAGPEHAPSEEGRVFMQEMTDRAVADIGQPIEGFDATLLMQAYPGLVAADFDGVKTEEGHYEAAGETLSFVRDQAQPISTVERTISAEGYETLLSHLAMRFGVSLDDGNISEIIDRIDTGEHVSIMLGETAEVFGVAVSPEEIREDSRCPIDVECIQAGDVRVSASVQYSGRSETHEFSLNKLIVFSGVGVRLVRVDPPPVSTESISESEYAFVFYFTTQP